MHFGTGTRVNRTGKVCDWCQTVAWFCVWPTSTCSQCFGCEFRCRWDPQNVSDGRRLDRVNVSIRRPAIWNDVSARQNVILNVLLQRCDPALPQENIFPSSAQTRRIPSALPSTAVCGISCGSILIHQSLPLWPSHCRPYPDFAWISLRLRNYTSPQLSHARRFPSHEPSLFVVCHAYVHVYHVIFMYSMCKTVYTSEQLEVTYECSQQ